MSTYNYTKVKEFQALGGPEVANVKEAATPTREGRYVIGSIKKHVSGGRWALSTIEWGTPLRVEKDILQVKTGGAWKNVSSLPSFQQFKGNEKLLTEGIQKIYKDFKDRVSSKLTAKERVSLLPDTWIFNDFGHITIKYFRDKNNNYKLDKNEALLSDFVHTIPDDEFFTAHGVPFPLTESHGCIHMHPTDIDTVLTYVSIGSAIEVHSYTDSSIPLIMTRTYGKPTYELHFFPARTTRNGHAVMAVYSVTKL